MNEETRCGFISVIGLPNAGKSTLINTLVGSKISIVSKKVQTTRQRVLGILIHDKAQIILIDTPGVFSPQKTLERAMVGAAFEALDEADITLHLVDASRKDVAAKNEIIFKKITDDKKPAVLVLNKTDQVNKPDLLALAAALNEQHDYAATFMISGLKGTGTQDLLKDLAKRVPAGPYLFEEDQITDMPMRLMAAEITREKIFEQLYRELPHSTLVETEEWEEFKNGDVKISQVIFVQRETQKAIILGKGGNQIKKIGAASRAELEKIFDRTVHLKLFVKVEENWMERGDLFQS